MKLPSARNSDIVVQDLRQEVLIYDSKLNKAYCLNETASRVFRACNGTTTFAELKTTYGFSEDLILLSIGELQAAGLIENKSGIYINGLSRRSLIKRAGLSSVAALPLVSVLVAPKASSAASGQTACTGASANGSSVSANAGGGNFDNAAAQAACFDALNCRCQSGFAANKTITLCAGASSARSCSCSGTCSTVCVNPNGASTGSSVSGNGGGLGFDNSAAQAACLNNLNSRCCSGSATNTNITLCAGASSARSCNCTGTCA